MLQQQAAWLHAQQQAAAAAAAVSPVHHHPPGLTPFWPPVAAAQSPLLPPGLSPLPWLSQPGAWSTGAQMPDQPQQSESSEGGVTTSSAGAGVPASYWGHQGQGQQNGQGMDWQAQAGG